MPEFVARNAFGAGAHYAARGGGPEQLRKNLARVIGVPPAQVPDGLIRASLASYARYWREAFRLPSMDHAEARERIDAVTACGSEHVAGRPGRRPRRGDGPAAQRELGHGRVWMVQKHGTFTTVAERLKPESLYQRFIDYRESLGFEMLPLTGGERPPFEVLAERLRDNRFVCLMADRDLTRTGVQVDFFGEPTRMPAGPAKLAIETGATCFRRTATTTREAGSSTCQAPLDTSSGDVTAITQALADRFAKQHRRPSRGLAHDAAAMAGRPVRRAARPARGDLMRIGMVCPYSFDVPRRRAVARAAAGRGDAMPAATTSACWRRPRRT